jgi:opine dehydrogenase
MLHREQLRMEMTLTDNSSTTIAIIGAGMGGVYLLAFLGLAGYTVRLHDIDDAKLANVREAGGVKVEGRGFSPAAMVSTDLKASVDGAAVIIVVTGGNYQESVARGLAPLLKDGQIILLIQGNTGGALLVRRTLDALDCKAKVDIAEMDNFPHSCWRRGPAHIDPIVTKRNLQIATFPGNRIEAVFSVLGPMFPTAVAMPSIAHTSFTNANAMLHVANCVGNAGKIDEGGNYRFYADGVTPLVARLYEAINAERVAVAAALGARVRDLADWFEITYGVRGKTLSETAQKLTTNTDGPYQATGTPKDFDHKYIAEDVPAGLIPMSEIGKAAGVPTPAIDALIQIVKSMSGKTFAAEARTLDRMGLSGKDAAGIRNVLERGFA